MLADVNLGLLLKLLINRYLSFSNYIILTKLLFYHLFKCYHLLRDQFLQK